MEPLESIRSLWRRGDRDEALRSLDELLGDGSRDARLWSERGLYRSELGRSEEALSDFQRSFALEPGYPAAYNAGNMLLGLGRVNEALAMYEASVRCFEGYPEAWVNRGIVLHRMGRAREAIASFDRARAIDSTHVPAVRCKAITLESVGKKEESESLYAHIVALRPGDVQALAEYAMALSRLPIDGHLELHPHGREWRALEALSSVLEQAPDHLGAFRAKAEVLWRSAHANVAFRVAGPTGFKFIQGPLRCGSFHADLRAHVADAEDRFPDDPWFAELRADIEEFESRD